MLQSVCIYATRLMAESDLLDSMREVDLKVKQRGEVYSLTKQLVESPKVSNPMVVSSLLLAPTKLTRPSRQRPRKSRMMIWSK